MPTKISLPSVPAISESNIQKIFSYRMAGWSAIASGTIGMLACGFLIAYLVLRNLGPDAGILMNRLHDAGVAIQFLLLIPFVFGLHKFSKQQSPGMSRATLAIGVGAILFVALFLLLIYPKVVADILYMFPQGIFGAWLVVVCWRMRNILTAWLCWFGIFVGLGLALVGVFPLGYTLLVDPILLQIPAAPAEEVEKIPVTPANMVLHQILWIGSLMGVLNFPFWSIFLGYRMLRESRI